MDLNNEFRVGVPPAVAWSVLTDVERIAPCMPGAQLQEIEGDEFRGVVKVKVGPITAQYKGKATFLEREQEAGRLVLRAEGRDTRGQGNANATITATLLPDGDGTQVTVVTDLTVTGKVAQFGRGVLAEVSAKLLNQFVACLERDVLAAGGQQPAAEVAAGAAGSESAAASASPAPPPAPSSAPPAPAPAPVSTGAAGSPPPAPSSAPPAPVSTGAAGSPTSGSPTSGPAVPTTPAPSAGNGSTGDDGASRVRRIDSPEAAPVDLLDAAGGSVARRALPALAGILVVLLGLVRWRRRRSRRSSHRGR